MPPTELILGGAIVVALVLYLLLGGADFGGGVWDLFAAGPRKQAQRGLIDSAIGPIWEANHVWLIVVVVLLFAGFPPAFAAISVALHVPLVALLLGIIFRGSAFTFRTYDSGNDRRQRRWGVLFSSASVVSPVLLGVVVGTVASGQLRVRDGVVETGFFSPWLQPFPWAIGFFTLSLCAFLAATYLAHEAEAPELKEDFRLRALASGISVGAFALLGFLLSAEGAPVIRAGLSARSWSGLLHLATGVAAVGALAMLAARRYALARYLAGAQATLIVLGWAASQYPYLVVPDLTVQSAAAHPATRKVLVIALAAGTPLLLPCFYLLFRLFKGQRAFAMLERNR